MELRLRPYKPCDADIIAGWIKDELAMRKWSSDRFGDFPLSGDMINLKYVDNNGDCPEADNFYPMTAFDEKGIVGHLILRFTDAEKKSLRFGFIIVDDTIRGKGYGKQMLSLSLKYAFEIFKADKVTLGVFDNNPSAYHCYKSVGFKDTGDESFIELFGEQWRVIEMQIKNTDYFKGR